MSEGRRNRISARRSGTRSSMSDMVGGWLWRKSCQSMRIDVISFATSYPEILSATSSCARGSARTTSTTSLQTLYKSHLFFLKPGSSLRWSSQSSMRTCRTSMVSLILSATSLDPLNPESLSTSTSTSTSPISSSVSFTNVAAAAGGVLSIKSSAIRR
ncbi:hypothetical protein B0H14DRAFT_1210177 [Mycena olivaceomarginata]|nr:hypothetical protein B0H14DRAFT_1210177 [Mycena olivaceomarginata]